MSPDRAIQSGRAAESGGARGGTPAATCDHAGPGLIAGVLAETARRAGQQREERQSHQLLHIAPVAVALV